MSDSKLAVICELIQQDVGNRGLRTDPSANLITSCAGDFEAAAAEISKASAVGIVTGFYIPDADPPCGETDGPLGAIFLARALTPLGIRVVLATDAFCRHAVEVGLAACGLRKAVSLLTLPAPAQAAPSALKYWEDISEKAGPLTHLIALERVGPSHSRESIQAQSGFSPDMIDRFLADVPADCWNRYYTMRGRDVSAHMSPAHLLFEAAPMLKPAVVTIGIGDGGNEIGMGKIPWDIIRRNISGGERLACRVATDHLIVCGTSNWGAYGLAAAVRWLRGVAPDRELFDSERELKLLRAMVDNGPLVDGITGQPTTTVDGLDFARYAEPLRMFHQMWSYRDQA